MRLRPRLTGASPVRRRRTPSFRWSFGLLAACWRRGRGGRSWARQSSSTRLSPARPTPTGASSSTLPAGQHDLAVVIGGQEVVRRQIDLSSGAPPDEQIFRVLTVGSAARYATKVRAARPEIPKIEVFGDEARQLPGSSGDPLRVLGSLPGVVADRLAGGALRGSRRQPGQHRLLPGRHSRPRAVSPGARAVGHSPLSDRRRRLLSGRVRRPTTDLTSRGSWPRVPSRRPLIASTPPPT